jgi:hypothetical protein
MNSIKEFLSILLLVSIIILLLNSCSVIGFLAGAVSDSNKPDSTVFYVPNLSEIKNGTPIKVDLKNGNRMAGYYLGYMHFDLIDYKKYYDDFLKTLPSDSLLPGIGEYVKIIKTDRIIDEELFLGFSADKLHLLHLDRTDSSIQINNINKIMVTYKNIYSINTIKEFISRPDFPLYAPEKINTERKVGIECDDGNEYFLPKEIDKIWVIPKKNKMQQGFFIGAVIDGLVFIIIKTTKPFKLHGTMTF